ncbi:MAG TPA: hypothetical protein PLK48_06350 [Caldisericia bacterium]|nr:hypothetical protein [Caldisericia bacterium]
MIDLTPYFIESFKRKRVIGRYSVTDLWAIIHGYLPPENYLEEESFKVSDIVKMINGTVKHKILEEFLIKDGWQIEIKKEFPYEDIVFVGKVDAINDKEILEIKTSDKIIPVGKDWQKLQLKVYLTMFERESGCLVQPVYTNEKIYLKKIDEIKRDDEYVFNVFKKVKEFHNQLLNYGKIS